MYIVKIINNDKIYVQKKDLELIFKSTDSIQIPSKIAEIYKENIDKNDIDFITFSEKNIIDYLNKFWFIINYTDYVNISLLESVHFYIEDLQKLRTMRIEYDKHKFFKEEKFINDWFDYFLYEGEYIYYIPNRVECKKYPIDFQLLFNKIMDILELNHYKSGNSKLKLPEEVQKPIYYTKKQLQKIYYEVLSENLSFVELKPYEKQLYSIFTRIDYSPNILEIIRKIIILNKYNTINFIDDNLLDLLLHITGNKSKFQEDSFCIIDYIYAIGYNNFENFESKIVLENDLKIIMKIIDYIGRVELKDVYIERLSKYNHVLAEIVRAMKKSEYSFEKSFCVNDIFLNILTYIYFNPNIINYDYDFIIEVYNYIDSHEKEIVNYIGYDINKNNQFHKSFVKIFNVSNSLLIHLYNNTKKKILKKN